MAVILTVVFILCIALIVRVVYIVIQRRKLSASTRGDTATQNLIQIKVRLKPTVIITIIITIIIIIIIV